METRMIAIYSPSLRGGGAERVMYYLACEFVKRQMSVDMVLVKAEGRFLEELPSEVRVIDLASSGVLNSFPRLVRYLLKERPRSLLATQIHSNIIALLAKRLSGVSTKLVVREANILKSPSKQKSSFRRYVILKLARYCYPWADSVVAVSQGVADDLMQYIRLPREQITVIYNPIERSRLLKLASEKINYPWFDTGEPPVVLGIGRLSEQKDFETLIRAFKIVREKIQARLIILGEGELRPVLETFITELKLDKDVVLPGHVSNPYVFLKHASVFVLSSKWEGLPNSLIEAMAIGIPVVATDCHSGPREILDDGKFGRLVPVGNTEEMAKSIMYMLLNKKISVPDVKALELFDMDYCINAYLKLLNHK